MSEHQQSLASGESQPGARTDRFASALLVTLGTLLGYIVGFYYWKGRFDYFGIPSTLVELSITDIFIAIGGTWLTIYLLLNFFYVSLQKFGKHYVSRKVVIVMIVPIIYALYGFLSGWSTWEQWLPAILLTAFLILIEFLWPPIFSYTGTYAEKLKQSDEFEWKVEDLAMAAGRRYKGPAIIVVLILFLLPVIEKLGYHNSSTQKSFPVYSVEEPDFVEEEQPCAVIKVSSDYMACAGFLEGRATLQNWFLVIPITAPVKLETKRVGPLVHDPDHSRN